ncbi:Intraflagellar transport protein 22 [Boothiomyces macroporosus]|uniref:Intraflagellar transport protein 22 n=1 Tax=Boothiomyces macroporosus TaxID=261099 RepID=A0AAD5UI46_9FUNG|nr:Intraflagellar transport protein 22 [Boothiomyces macroporosus]
MDSKLVVFMAGPQKTGKTAITNYLAEMSESLESNEYRPTQGVRYPTTHSRILEIEKKLIADPKKGQKWREANVTVELWDCSGDLNLVDCWRAFSNKIHGAIFVVSADGKNDKDLDPWQEAIGLAKPNQYTIFAHKQVQSGGKTKVKPTNKVLSKSPIVYTNLDQDPESIKTEFDSFLSNIYSVYLENREREENAIV